MGVGIARWAQVLVSYKAPVPTRARWLLHWLSVPPGTIQRLTLLGLQPRDLQLQLCRPALRVSQHLGRGPQEVDVQRLVPAKHGVRRTGAWP